MNNLIKHLSENEVEEERFIRGSIFKKVVPRLYQNQCCISGMRIETSINAQMIDACHIIPFSTSNDDTVTNGISLSPTLHRAYDRGLITINEGYIVRIYPTIKKTNHLLHCHNLQGVKFCCLKAERIILRLKI